MDSLLESNELTLVIFDSVCMGLAECLMLVSNDIGQMSEHRDRLAEQLEQQACEQAGRQLAELSLGPDASRPGEKRSAARESGQRRAPRQTDLDVADSSGPDESIAKGDDDDDPHHLARLKLLDKRLADSFSQALSMCDQQKSSLVARRQAAALTNGAGGGPKRSIFQVLFGKGNSSNRSDKQQRGAPADGKTPAGLSKVEQQQRDAQIEIDDIHRQTLLAVHYFKQLKAHLLKVEDLRAHYEMHLKMGLKVKNVPRASLPRDLAHSFAPPAMINSPDSLGRRPNHHSSTILVNDRSSLGTRSSLSSLNLSTWSFSRRQLSDRSAASRKDLAQNAAAAAAAAAHCCSQQSAGDLCPSALTRNQKCVSTSSLDLASRQRSRRGLSLSKLISSNKQHQLSVQNVPACVLDYPTHLDQRHGADQVGQQPFVQCQCNSHHASEPPPVSPQSADHMSRYIYGAHGEFATPTTTGTLAGGYLDASGSVVMGAAEPAGSLHKSASHSSLKKRLRGDQNGSKLSSSRQAKQSAPGLGLKASNKEFWENVDRIKSEFESYMGSFLVHIEDIQGFARVCQGDVFEINIKYGDSQKFKTTISVLKNGQKCDHKQTVFKSRIADVIAIKAYECKGLGKRVLLGHKLCETRDLFTARSQLMTISLNQTGSIKLNLIITWNPLHMAPRSLLDLSPGLDVSHVSLPPTPVSTSTLSSLSSAQSSLNGAAAVGPTCVLPPITNNTTTTINIQSSKNNHGIHAHSLAKHRQASPALIVDSPHSEPMTAHYHYHPTATVVSHHSHVRPPRDQHRAHQLGQNSDAIYNYRIPEPDYLTTGDLKY